MHENRNNPSRNQALSVTINHRGDVDVRPATDGGLDLRGGADDPPVLVEVARRGAGVMTATAPRVRVDQTTVVVADPPWPHANGSRTNSGKSPKYPLMRLDEIAALGPTVLDLVGSDAVLYMWVTGPCLLSSQRVVSDWGFTYRSFHVWEKVRPACGFWSRCNAEVVLVCERGRPAAPPAAVLPQTRFRGAASRAHSTKPDSIHEIVERLWPDARKVELFARRQRDGWETYGADLGTILSSDGVVVSPDEAA